MRSLDLRWRTDAQLITDSQDLDAICDHFGISKYRDDITGAIVVIDDGDYRLCYLTEDAAPYLNTADYTPVSYWKD